MSSFTNDTRFNVEYCCNCGIPFAMTSDFQRRRREDRKDFYCPAGHPQHYAGPTETQKLKTELERKEQMLSAAHARANAAEYEKQQISAAHKKMRERVMNGVCPCCNRSFQNLMQHMRAEHPDFSSTDTMRTLRMAFGMTQAAVAGEAKVEAAHVSLYERGKNIPSRAKDRLDAWIERHHSDASSKTVSQHEQEQS